MKIKKSWSTVTPTSKAFALALFIALPIVAFLLGAKWQKLQDMAILTENYGRLQLENNTVIPGKGLRPNDYTMPDDEMMHVNGTPMPVGL